MSHLFLPNNTTLPECPPATPTSPRGLRKNRHFARNDCVWALRSKHRLIDAAQKARPGSKESVKSAKLKFLDQDKMWHQRPPKWTGDCDLLTTQWPLARNGCPGAEAIKPFHRHILRIDIKAGYR
jgi:hypothetical protein